ncbi:MAG: hypothetical protein JNM22_04610 [Saprospiraceae bacterium]|nr:hypothetical protein [Saprospiraceae bacterium]
MPKSKEELARDALFWVSPSLPKYPYLLLFAALFGSDVDTRPDRPIVNALSPALELKEEPTLADSPAEVPVFVFLATVLLKLIDGFKLNPSSLLEVIPRLAVPLLFPPELVLRARFNPCSIAIPL